MTADGTANGFFGGSKSSNSKTTYIVVGVVAAAVSAATVAYFFWSRSRALSPHVDTVQDLLTQAHDKMHRIEERLKALSENAGTTS